MATIQEDIDRGLEIVAEVAKLEAEFKQIATRVQKVALKGKQIPLEDHERDGMQYLAKGSEKVVPVIITADFLVKSFVENSAAHEKIRAVLNGVKKGGMIGHFYKPKTTFERTIDDGKAFRKSACQILGDLAAAPFIKACVSTDKDGIPKNAIKIEWARAKSLEEVPA